MEQGKTERTYIILTKFIICDSKLDFFLTITLTKYFS